MFQIGVPSSVLAEDGASGVFAVPPWTLEEEPPHPQLTCSRVVRSFEIFNHRRNHTTFVCSQAFVRIMMLLNVLIP